MAESVVGVDSEEAVEEPGETRRVVNLSGEVQQLQLAPSLLIGNRHKIAKCSGVPPARRGEPAAASSAPNGVAQRARRAASPGSAPPPRQRVERGDDRFSDRTREALDHPALELDHDLSAMRVQGGHHILPGQATPDPVGAPREVDCAGFADPADERDAAPGQGEIEPAVRIPILVEAEPGGQGSELRAGGRQHHPREAAAVSGDSERPVRLAGMVVPEEPGTRPAHRREFGAAVAPEDAVLPTGR